LSEHLLPAISALSSIGHLLKLEMTEVMMMFCSLKQKRFSMDVIKAFIRSSLYFMSGGFLPLSVTPLDIPDHRSDVRASLFLCNIIHTTINILSASYYTAYIYLALQLSRSAKAISYQTMESATVTSLPCSLRDSRVSGSTTS
jgi:hypothetical protein